MEGMSMQAMAGLTYALVSDLGHRQHAHLVLHFTRIGLCIVLRVPAKSAWNESEGTNPQPSSRYRRRHISLCTSFVQKETLCPE